MRSFHYIYAISEKELVINQIIENAIPITTNHTGLLCGDTDAKRSTLGDGGNYKGGFTFFSNIL